ncbi:MAG: pyruvate flavodoxin/ferredoxin oxidoreductase [Deltaproteobacteria bacterium]|nr:pyruvate flavodoxin/ferredoxin oxidoreductase [Deltaproteobacteria bacterium]
MALSLLDGNETVALGAAAAGCKFFAGYPITPATSIFNAMLNLLPQKGGVCMQGEDEIASIGYCLGASMAGVKAMTATSGPGISLYSENISFAIGSEIPIVIVDVQRLGPSTGSATRGADGDIQFLRWGSSSGLPIIVLAPVDAADCYILTKQAFNLAEQFRCPVFIASNKEIALTKESIDLNLLEKPEIIERKLFSGKPDEEFMPFAVKKSADVPEFLPIGFKGRLARQTSSTHGAKGYITIDASEIEKNQNRLQHKIEACVDAFTYFEEVNTDAADTLIICYGITARAVKAAVNILKKDNISASALILKTLWPAPEKLIKQKTEKFNKIVVIEMNKGQYVKEIERILCDKKIKFFGQMNGVLIEPEQISEVIKNG